MEKLALCLVVLGACVVESPEDLSEETPRLSPNALSPSTLAQGLVTTSVLNGTNAAAMGANAQARKVLSYAVTCALDSTQTVNYTVGGTAYSATGLMGVATSWTTTALSTSQAAWVSACVLSRINLTSALVTISARGAQAGYATTTNETTDYRVEEGAFWGNVFTDLGSISGYACTGVDQSANDTYGDLPVRECAEWDGVTGSNLTPCGFHYAGLCSAVCSTGSAYSGCAYQGGTASSEVVTTFLYGSLP